MAHPKAGRPGEGAPVKVITALLLAGDVDVDSVITGGLEPVLGPADYRGPPRPFDITDYYEDEMGKHLGRMIVSFKRLSDAPGLVGMKIATAELESRLAVKGSRRINIDVGYIDYFKVVLASFKEGPQKIYLGRGVYADPVLMYEDGGWIPLPWSFPDFRDGRYDDDFAEIRSIYRAQRRMGGTAR
jgi:hypothetical protein